MFRRRLSETVVVPASEFWVGVQRTDAATRCGLHGSYWLQVGLEALLLREPQRKNIVREWPYELLRRYGKDEVRLIIKFTRLCDFPQPVHAHVSLFSADFHG